MEKKRRNWMSTILITCGHNALAAWHYKFVNYHQQRLQDGISQHTSRRPGCNCLPCMGGDLAKCNTRPWPWRYSTYVFTWSLLLLCTFQQSITQFMQLREVDMQKPKPPPPPPPPLPLWVPSFMCRGYSWLCACTYSEFLLMQMFVAQVYKCVCEQCKDS
jgi:hypothetical protein